MDNIYTIFILSEEQGADQVCVVCVGAQPFIQTVPLITTKFIHLDLLVLAVPCTYKRQRTLQTCLLHR